MTFGQMTFGQMTFGQITFGQMTFGQMTSTYSFSWEDVDRLWRQPEPSRGEGSLLHHLVEGHQVHRPIL